MAYGAQAELAQSPVSFPKVRQLQLNLAHIRHTSFILLSLFCTVVYCAVVVHLWHLFMTSQWLARGRAFPACVQTLFQLFSAALEPHTHFFLVGKVTFLTMLWQSCAYLKDDFSVLLLSSQHYAFYLFFKSGFLRKSGFIRAGPHAVEQSGVQRAVRERQPFRMVKAMSARETCLSCYSPGCLQLLGRRSNALLFFKVFEWSVSHFLSC